MPRHIVHLVALTALVPALTAADAATLDPDSVDLFRPYQLDACLVSDAAIGSMGDGRSMVYQGQEITFCCGGCLDQFAAKPDTYLAKMRRLEQGADKASQKDHTGHKDHAGHKDHKGHKDHAGHKDHKGHKDHTGHKDHKGDADQAPHGKGAH